MLDKSNGVNICLVQDAEDIIIAIAGIAQLVEQLLRKQLVGGSSPLSGTISRTFQVDGFEAHLHSL